MLNPIETAQQFIRLFHQVETPNEEQHLMLAAAHYTLANRQDVSLPRCRFHANSAVTVLQNIKNKKSAWRTQIAEAYFKRAELLEEQEAYSAAVHDYLRVIELIENQARQRRTTHTTRETILPDESKLLLSKCAISIADLIVNDQVDYQQVKYTHPLIYINKALESLNTLRKYNEEVYAIEAYAHQLAGISFNIFDFDAAKKAFQEALHIAFKADLEKTYILLTDIYNCLGLLHETKFQNNLIQNPVKADLDEAMIYFTIALLFSKIHITDEHEERIDLESLFEIVYRVLDPNLPRLSKTLFFNVTDGFIYTYIGLVEGSLPNQPLKALLAHAETLDLFAQHIYLLVRETYYHMHPTHKTLTLFTPDSVKITVDNRQMMSVIQNNLFSNVHYLEDFKK